MKNLTMGFKFFNTVKLYFETDNVSFGITFQQELRLK